MKKMLAMILALVMVLSLAACGGSGSGENTGAPENTEPTGSAMQILESGYEVEQLAIAVQKGNTELLNQLNTALAELEADGTLAAISNYFLFDEGEKPVIDTSSVAADAETLVMATSADYPPYEYYENDEVTGLDATLALALATKLGKKLEITDMDFNSIVAAVQSGKVDMGVAAMSINEDRLQSVDFTDFYETAVWALVVPSGSPITSMDDLRAEGADYVIGVQTSTTGDYLATDEFGEDHILRYNKANDLLLALKQGKVDCAIVDERPATAFNEAQ